MFPSSNEKIFNNFQRIIAIFAAMIIALIFVFLFIESIPVVKNMGVSSFFSDQRWDPSENQYLLTPMILGTLVSSCLALLLAFPISLVMSLYLNFYASNPIQFLGRRLIELLAGIPSVVYGFWGLTMLVPFIGEHFPPGSNLLSGALILSLMILPTITLLMDRGFIEVDKQQRLTAAALGFSTWGKLRYIIIDLSKNMIGTAGILAFGRALGETMAILMVCGNVFNYPTTLFKPIRTLTANMALEMAYAMGDHRSALFVTGFLLILMVAALILFTHLFVGQKEHYA